MESIKPAIVKFAISKLSFWVSDDKHEQLTLSIEKKTNCKLNKDKRKDKLYITQEISATSAPAGAFEFSAVCRAVVSAQTNDIPDDELKEKLEQIYIPLVDQEIIERVKKISKEMGQPILDLSIDNKAVET